MGFDWNWKFWKRQDSHDQPLRRIYTGDVPYLRDVDNDESKKQKPNESEIDLNKPRSVRRHSFSKDALPNLKPQEAPEVFPTNMIITSRYNMWNFLPKNLFEQFRRIVNFYFLMIAMIQVNIDSPVHPVTAVSPLTFVICVTAIKQGYEDWLRHKNDDIVNNRPVKIVKTGQLTQTKAKDIVVGDIIKLDSNEQVPTDLLLLGSSDEFMRCQINTANLDGETNLKLRYCPSGLPHYRTPEDFTRLHAIVECEHPCEDLYEFSGALLLPADKLTEMNWSPAESGTTVEAGARERHDASKKEHIETLKSSGMVRQGMTDFISIPLSMENMVLRGTRLKNTDFIYGIVVYTGRDTRLARNSEKTQAKFSTVESAVNWYLMFFIGLLILMVIFCSVMHYCINWYDGIDGTPWYIQTEGKKSSEIFQTVASFVILFNYIIPISLYVTIELQKFLGSKFFVWDNEMVDEEGKEPLCNTSDLNEELGQIEYLFSDKTGTLTQNLMQFRHCSIKSVRYEYRSDDKLYVFKSDSKKDANDSRPVDVPAKEEVFHFIRTLALCHSVQVVPKRRPSFDVAPVTTPLIDRLKLSKSSIPSKNNVLTPSQARRQSLVTPEPSKEVTTASSSDSTMEYQASSPDEKALLESCEKLGVHYTGEKEDMLRLNIRGREEQYRRLMQLEFDADRKCMSVIIENSKGEIWLLTKGAESSIIPKCDQGPAEDTLKHVMDFALMGLRTLAVAERKISRKEYEDFNQELRAARRMIKNRQEKVREVYSSIETHLNLLGATGVEDQLQDYVPETLQAFAAAGIRVWMLTGDKLETGVNVAVSCGLITASCKQFIVSSTSNPMAIKGKLAEFKNEIDQHDNTCFIIDGQSLGVAFMECPDLLRDVSMAALRVVCCRMAPLQKAQVVQMVKNSPKKPTCCAVGDGANDCAMILAAHVGIGILGKEGRQAARCADFALAKFGYLRRAVLMHGHWYYNRLANLANYFFYKNIVFVFPQFFFSFHSNFSTQAIFNGLFLMNYNIFFSSFPIFIFGLTEQPHSAQELLSSPHLYKKNRKNALMTVKKFIPWVFSGVWHAMVSYYLTYLSWNNFDRMNDLSTFGTVVFTGVVITSNNKMAVETKYVTLWYVGAQIFSYLTFFIITSIYSEVDLHGIGLNPGDFQHVFYVTLSSPNFWLLMILVAVVAILPDLTFAVVRHSWKHLVRHFKTFGKDRKWLKIRRKSVPFPTLMFTKRSGSLAISSSTLSSYMPKSNA